MEVSAATGRAALCSILVARPMPADSHPSPGHSADRHDTGGDGAPVRRSVLFVIPARGGSKGLPGKNLRPLGGIPLVGRAIRAARAAAGTLPGTGHRVVCSTDDAHIAAVAAEWGADVPFTRPPHLASDEADSVGVAIHALDWYASEGRSFGAMALVQATTPLLSADDLVGAVRLFFESGGKTVVSVGAAPHAAWTFRLADDRLSPLVPETLAVARRQEAAAIVALNGAVFVSRPETLRQTRRFVDTTETRAYVMPPDRSIDVDSETDLRACEGILAARPGASLSIGGRRVGPQAPCFLIAEAGVNHNGDPALARRLVVAAAEAGADAVKFQTFEAELLAAPGAPRAPYQERDGVPGADQRTMLRALCLPRESHAELMACAAERGMIFLSSPFDERSADFLETLDVAAFKIPSGELTNHPFLRHVACKGRPVLLSTGMATLAEVAEAVDAVRAAGDPPLALFHCVSSYPTPAAEANLRAMDTLALAFGAPTGWSDHTMGTEVAVAAVARGARLVEKHLTLDRSLPGPDHAASLEPAEFARMAREIRSVESALGTGVKQPRDAERAIAAIARKSLHWRVAAPAGERVDADKLIALRPGTGMPPSGLSRLLGRRLRTAVAAGSLVREEDLEPLA
jgi:N,N'-diacetyllegionaminate synthase